MIVDKLELLCEKIL